MMAEVVDVMPESRGNKPIYPWHEWLDGRIWKLTKGEDFQVSVKSFQTLICLTRKARGIKIASRRFGDVIFIQAIRDKEHPDDE